MTPRPAIEVTTLTIHIPMQFKRRGGRKLILAPDGVASPVSPKPTVDGTMLKLLIKAHSWRRRIESGRSKSITDLAAQEKVTIAYAGRVMNLTCLAPDIVAAILDGRQPRGLSVNAMLKEVAAGWERQREAWGFPAG
jgi:hypothetical protein